GAPIQALVKRYMARRGVSAAEAGRQLGRDESAIRAVMNGRTEGLKPWRGEQPLLSQLITLLEIPDREWRRAVADALLAEMESGSNTSRRTSKTWLTQTMPEQREPALAAGF